MACLHRLLGSDGLDGAVRTQPAGQLLDASDALIAALLDDVGRAELAGQRLPVGVTAHRDDPRRAELLGGEDAEKTDRAVSDDRDRLAGADLRRDGREPARAEDIGCREK